MSMALVEELLELTALKYMGDCKCGRCQLIPMDLLTRTIVALASRPASDAVMLAALKAVEDWWLTQGMKHFDGAPYAIFATRDAIAIAEAQSPKVKP